MCVLQLPFMVEQEVISNDTLAEAISLQSALQPKIESLIDSALNNKSHTGAIA